MERGTRSRLLEAIALGLVEDALEPDEGVEVGGGSDAKSDGQGVCDGSGGGVFSACDGRRPSAKVPALC